MTTEKAEDLGVDQEGGLRPNQQQVQELTTITFTNDEWCEIHMAVLARRQALWAAREYTKGDEMVVVAEKILTETHNFAGVE